jgi:16S rRNA (cytosine967-C5)-methyltransferase
MSRPADPAGRPTRPPRRTSAGPRADRPRVATGPPRRRPAVADAARTVALETLRAVHERDAYANLVLPGLLRKAGLRGRDAGLATELAYGTLRMRGAYDAVLAACTDRPLSAIDDEVLDALRLGVHQILAMRIPPHAAVATTVDLVRLLAGPGASRFANAVLRRVTDRDAETWVESVAPAADTDPDGHLAVVHSHPEWIVRALRDALRNAGRDVGDLPGLLAADNLRPQVAAIALPGLAEPGELIADGGDPGRWSPFAVLLTGAPEDVPAVREGRARIQDEGSQLVALALAGAALTGPDAGRWLDLCAGPGGKAAVLAASLGVLHEGGRIGDEAGLVAVEVSEHRADLVSNALQAVPAAYTVRVADGRTAAAGEEGGYDRVLVDAPCTGLGALRRRPEARWRRSPSDLATLAPLQRDLLTAALDAVRPGGVVAYSTCSPHPAETGTVVSDVLRGRDDVERLDAAAVVRGIAPDIEVGDGPDVQLWPDRHGTDGMYLALLRRR